jgi:phage tail-like protein
VAALRPFALVQSEDQWRRAGHDGTALEPGTWAVQLAWSREDNADALGVAPEPGGLAFDPWCRLYRSDRSAGQVFRQRNVRTSPLADAGAVSEVLPLFAEAPMALAGDFAVAGPTAGPLNGPQGLAVDASGRLFVAETTAARVLVFDLADRRLLGEVAFFDEAGSRRSPRDLATDGRTVFATLDAAPWLVRFDARRPPRAVMLPDGIADVDRVAVAPSGALRVLVGAGTDSARVIPLDRPEHVLDVPHATDLAVHAGGAVVVARRPGEDFLRLTLGDGGWLRHPRLKAKGFDGSAVVRTPDDRIGFWTARGFRTAVVAAVRYARSGRVTTFRLDSGQFQTNWGRLFLDACIPRGTEVRLHCAVADEPPDGLTVARHPPANTDLPDDGRTDVFRPELSPPMLPKVLGPPDPPGGPETPAPRPPLEQTLHRRDTGRELPWARHAAGDRFETYEAPIIAPAGRFLWVTLELRGDTRVTPRVRSVRAEHPSHDLLRRLPVLYSRDEPAADFLRRYLMSAEGMIADLDARAFARRALVDPRSTPAELLPWLASFLGLVLDERWPLAARRTLIEEAIWLFKFRGTIPGLLRFLEIYLGVRPVIVEHFRLRGLGGGYVGAAGPAASRAVLGAGFRVGGAVGTPGEDGSGEAETGDAADAYAHRFSVIVPAMLDDEQRSVVEQVIEVHRPAHTAFDLCTVESGMRVGIALYVGLTTVVGHGGAFDPLRVGGALLGRSGVLGWAAPGTRPGSSRLGGDTRVG